MPSLHFAPKSSALILIDLQNGITSRQLAPYSSADVVSRAKQLATELRRRGSTIVFVHVLMSEVLSLPVDSPTRDPNAPPPPASASELREDLDRQPEDLIITKRQWGAFYGTELGQQLHRRGIRTIIIGGIATNFGVESTARAAFDRGYELIFVEDAMSSFSADAHQFATQTIFPRMGRVRSTQQVLEAA